MHEKSKICKDLDVLISLTLLMSPLCWAVLGPVARCTAGEYSRKDSSARGTGLHLAYRVAKDTGTRRSRGDAALRKHKAALYLRSAFGRRPIISVM